MVQDSIASRIFDILNFMESLVQIKENLKSIANDLADDLKLFIFQEFSQRCI